MTNKKQIGVIEPSDLNDIIYNNGQKCFMGGIRVPYYPNSEDCWSNPYDEYKNTRIKSNAWVRACNNKEFALDCNGDRYPISDFSIGELAFCAGLWRIQEKISYKITKVRDQDMVLTKKLNRVENTLFEFWRAKKVSYNCYGPFVIDGSYTDYVVAKYETDNGTRWGYGKTIEDARAYLGIKLYDEYKEVINAIACKDRIKNSQK